MTDVQSLLALANRCLRERPSRALDARIYCAVLGASDANELETMAHTQARANGMVLIRTAGLIGWLQVPHYTGNLAWAKSLVPDGLHTISTNPAIVCATALMAMAMTMTEEPLSVEA